MSNKSKKKKICFLSSVPVTLWSFYRDLIRQLINRDFELTLISSDLPELYKLEKELNCSVYAVPILRQISPLNDVLSIRKLWSYLYQHKCDIIHAHTPKGGLVGMISSWLARIPNRVYTVHGLVLETAGGLKRRLLWLAEWLCCKLATKVLAVSPSLRQCVIDQRICPAEKIQVLGHGSACGIDLNVFTLSKNLTDAGRRIRNKYDIPGNSIVIGFVGRVVPDKGIKELVEAFELLPKNMPDAYLLIVGEFETVREVLDNKTMSIINNNDHICCNNEFTDDVVPFYTAMDILTLPTRREGFGLTLIEAAALELPTIGTKVTGCVDAVADGVSGLLVEVDNSQELYDAMLTLVQDAELRKKLGSQGRQRVEQLFDSKLLIDKHISLYKGMLDKNAK